VEEERPCGRCADETFERCGKGWTWSSAVECLPIMRDTQGMITSTAGKKKEHKITYM
jgi:hypothetical protein